MKILLGPPTIVYIFVNMIDIYIYNLLPQYILVLKTYFTSLWQSEGKQDKWESSWGTQAGDIFREAVGWLVSGAEIALYSHPTTPPVSNAWLEVREWTWDGLQKAQLSPNPLTQTMEDLDRLRKKVSLLAQGALASVLWEFDMNLPAKAWQMVSTLWCLVEYCL